MRMDSDQVVDPSTVHLLVVVAQAARGEELRRRLLGVSRGRSLELCLLAPAFAGSGLEYLASDVDPGIGRALERLERSLVEMRCEQVVAARGEVGESDPMLAIDSALVTFDADEIVLLPSPQRDQWAEKQLFERVCERFELPVREIELSEDQAGVHALQVAQARG
jgi:GABA permease